MATAVYTHEAGRAHVTPPGHPEQVARLDAVERGLAGLAAERREAPRADPAEILRCHSPRHWEAISRSEPLTGFNALDGDTFMAPGSLEAALRAVGAVTDAVDLVLAGGVANAFAGCRPPGHHAERERAMGFCLFGNVAIAAKRALDHHGLDRVAIVDFDVHHGNGTQDLLWDEPRVLFVSSHQMPLYPGSGKASERGAHGQILNVPLRPNTGGAEMRAAYDEVVFPELEEFEPELVLISAGFDAHAADPLAHLNWTEADFAWLTARLCDIAEAHAEGRVVSTLEGGYDLPALAASIAAHVGVLTERGR
jgi:acetoin utilization deacetylase AcuC-like enzyme